MAAHQGLQLLAALGDGEGADFLAEVGVAGAAHEEAEVLVVARLAAVLAEPGALAAAAGQGLGDEGGGESFAGAAGALDDDLGEVAGGSLLQAQARRRAEVFVGSFSSPTGGMRKQCSGARGRSAALQ